MIPKKIHYCWFGHGEKPALAQKCIESWKKYCPDYEIIEWNEDNFDMDYNEYVRYCYENKKWAFLSDFVRLVVIYEQGGIYFDTDVEVIRSFDELIKESAFFGFENNEHVATGLGFGAISGHPTVLQMIKEYDFFSPAEPEVKSCPGLNTQALVKMGLIPNGQLQKVAGSIILPKDYLNPYDDPTGRLQKTKNTYSIHWYAKSWISRSAILRSKLTKPFHRIFGVDCFKWLKK